MKKVPDVIKEIRKSQLMNYHRGKSWEHCYVFFRNYKKFRKNNELLNYAALHLGFFLASWGMLRGSSFLLQKDYKFYVPIVEVLIEKKYDKLWKINWFQLGGKERKDNLGRLFGLKGSLGAVIAKNNKDDGDDKKHATELIITKIIMATMGCVPAYDQFFKGGLRKWKKEKKDKKLRDFNEKSFRDLLVLSKKELKKIYKVRPPLENDKNTYYPPMKLIDLHFWLLGQ